MANSHTTNVLTCLSQTFLFFFFTKRAWHLLSFVFLSAALAMHHLLCFNLTTACLCHPHDTRIGEWVFGVRFELNLFTICWRGSGIFPNAYVTNDCERYDTTTKE
ncbi:hypothetical protein K504DRAFT_216067 [Pleomassaria siparia CBS 279.74]|uniref:Uncharacterized protein n=1 Tax=Pleomassaria siparia CBS 279.74 TaxID=1314801 RepID=A0A6G1KFM0_9PLEO|nr:hypothetical protein K504DRAFT_216067 [Pleomassaria siparia CBS 279.74]